MLLPNTNHQPKLLLAQPSLKQGTLPRQTFTPSSSQNQSHCPYDKLTWSNPNSITAAAPMQSSHWNKPTTKISHLLCINPLVTAVPIVEPPFFSDVFSLFLVGCQHCLLNTPEFNISCVILELIGLYLWLMLNLIGKSGSWLGHGSRCLWCQWRVVACWGCWSTCSAVKANGRYCKFLVLPRAALWFRSWALSGLQWSMS